MTQPNPNKLDRRSFARTSLLTAAAASVACPSSPIAAAVPDDVAGAPVVPKTCPVKLPPILTADLDFYDVSRGTPKPHTLTGPQVAAARLTPDTWRCEITADPFVEPPHTKVAASVEKSLTLADSNALDLSTLRELGRKHEVHFLKAMQCLNIDTPLGQGLWSGVPLRDVLKLCGKINNVRRIYYWGYHNDDPKQIFKSSVSYTQCMETAPGELPVFLAYRLNGQDLSLTRGGPVRMIVPWSHGYKSIKWLSHIFLTNDPRIHDTYAENNNDPDSFLKSAAYLDKQLEKREFKVGEPVVITGTVISGLSGVERVEYWVRKVDQESTALSDDAVELLAGPWVACTLEQQPNWQDVLPTGLAAEQLLGFDAATDRPRMWPPRYGMCAYWAQIDSLQPGSYEVRARAVDLNGFAQPEPRPSQKSGKNGIQVRKFTVLS